MLMIISLTFQLRKRWAVPGRYVGAGALPGNTLSGFCGHVRRDCKLKA